MIQTKIESRRSMASTAPNTNIQPNIINMGLYSSYADQKPYALSHSERFLMKTMLQFFYEGQSYCQYCYYSHKKHNYFMTTICSCGKIHQKCLSKYLRKNWKEVQKSDQFAGFYEFKCKKCRESIFFQDNYESHFVCCNRFTRLQLKIFIVTLLITVTLLSLIGLFIYLASTNESQAVKAILAILIIILVVILVIIFIKIYWKLFHAKFFKASFKEGQITKKKQLNKQFNKNSSNAAKDSDTLQPNAPQSPKKSTKHRYHQYFYKKINRKMEKKQKNKLYKNQKADSLGEIKNIENEKKQTDQNFKGKGGNL